MTLEKLLGGHSPEPPNLIIANVLYESRLLESWGWGIKLIMGECRKAGLPAPQYQADVTGAKLIFIYQGNVPVHSGQETGQETGQVTGQVMSLIRCLSE